MNSVIELSNEWHHNQQLSKGVGFKTWDGLPISDWEWDVDGKEADIWYISQILDSKKLLHEGKVMKHCVASYSSHCMSGYTAIFTLEHKYYGSRKKELTIEVNGSFVVVQARGKYNRPPDKEERKVLRKWAADRNLRL